jgi:hypothetical protein
MTDSFAGIEPANVPGFFAAQVAGAIVAVLADRFFASASASA